MKLKLTYNQFQALYTLFSEMIAGARPKGMQTKLLHAILMAIYKKLYVKALEKKKKYSIALTEQEALAFWLFFQSYPLEETMVFEANLLHSINSAIHQKFA